MALLISSTASLSFAPSAPIAPAPVQRSSAVKMETIADLEARGLDRPPPRLCWRPRRLCHAAAPAMAL